jgi:DcmR-like sensory protein
VSTALLVVVVKAFRKPNFLRAFLTTPLIPARPGLKPADRRAVVYPSDREKMGPVSRYINEGLNQNARIVLLFHENESMIRERLAREGVNVRRLITKGDLRFVSLGSLYQDDTVFDEETALDFAQQLASEVRATEKSALRLIIDFGDYLARPWQRFVDHLANPRWSTNDHFLDVMFMFQVSAFQGQQSALDFLKSKMQVIDLTEGLEAFSKGVGLSHQEITGKKILLEYDPLSDYDKVIDSLVVESGSNFEGVVIFTRKDSPVYTLLGEEPRLKMFILTSKVSYPEMETRDRFLLPAYDTSLLLDAINKTIETYGGVHFAIIFDNVSHYIFTMGAEKAQSFVRQSLELIISDKITAVYLMNPGAHDQKTVSTFENLFDLEILCRAGTRTPEVRKKMALPA